MRMQSVKLAISKQLIKQIDNLAERKSWSRSKLLREAVRRYLEERKSEQKIWKNKNYFSERV